MKTWTTHTGLVMPVLGLGTWKTGLDRQRRTDEIAALKLGLDLGMTLVDTAEMYADGGAEDVVGEALTGRRDDVVLVTKVLPENASRRGTVAACERSLKRLRTDRIDLYLLHWQGDHPLEDTLAAFAELRAAGKIRHFGVSNFDVDLMEQTIALPHGRDVAANQVLYNLSRRGIERRLMPRCVRGGIAVMAYSPLEQARLDFGGALSTVASRHGATPARIAIAWTILQDGVISIPKAASVDHVRDNALALDVRLDDADIALLDGAFPPLEQDVPLETL